ncbi:MAG: electron transport complex subunit RsxE [Spirochaetales bacterium]|nr:electron transport complex subunit RsxE [Spirochaetales bacterium]MBP7264291.1 electron transport complex subunit RsxE [Spirochaetia bacterium]
MLKLWKIFSKGLVTENPLLILMIGLCSAVAVTSGVANAIGMGAAMTFVIVFAELVISLFRKLIPNDARIPIFIIVIAAFTTMVDLAMKAYWPDLSESLGVFIPLIVVNCIIMGRVEAFASKENPLHAAVDALGMGLGYTWVLIGIAAVREILGAGAFLGIKIMPKGFQPILFFTLPPGGFMVFALFISMNLGIKRGMDARAKARLETSKEAS